MNITPPSDDTRLRAINRAKQNSGELQPIKELDKVARPAPIDQEREHQTRSEEEQRKGERRKQVHTPLLNTRQGHERRVQSRRSEAREQERTTEEREQERTTEEREQERTTEESSPSRGIDVRA